MRLRGSAMLRDLFLRPPAAGCAVLMRAQPLVTLCRRPLGGGRTGQVAAARLYPWWGGGGRSAGPLARGLSSSPSEILQELGKGGTQQQQQPPPQPGASPPAVPQAPGPKDGPGETDAFSNNEGKELVPSGEK